MSQRTEITKENICEDDMWFAANVEVVRERGGCDALTERYSNEDVDRADEIAYTCDRERELGTTYYDILEMAFDNYDADNG